MPGIAALAEEVLTGLGLHTSSDGELIKVTGAVARPRLVAELVEAGVQRRLPRRSSPAGRGVHEPGRSAGKPGSN